MKLRSHQLSTCCRQFGVLVLILLLLAGSIQSTATGWIATVSGSRPLLEDRAELHQALLDLTNPWSVMCVAAHPDDEDGTTLTMLRRKYGVHTVSLFSTYGEGGQNAVGPELYQELGVIRARETIAAAEIQGSTPYFLGLNDFGYSKSAEETFQIWGKQEALRRMVLKIRQLRPDAIITNHGPSRGHGHHQATGQLILEAFDAAANRSAFPEQLREVEVWQPKRLFVRFGFGGGPDTVAGPERIVTVDPNEVDPIRRVSFAEQALAALQQHATQGPWPKSIAERLRAQNRTELPLIRYRLVKEASSAPSLPANSRSFVEGLVLPLTTGAKLAPPAVNDRPITDFLEKPEEALVALINARKKGIFKAPAEVVDLDAERFRRMAKRLDRALAVASGSSLVLRTETTSFVSGVQSHLTATIANSGDTEIAIRKLTLKNWGVETPLEIAEKLPPGTDTSVVAKSMPPKSAHLTVPASEHLYDGRFPGEPISLIGELEIEGAAFEVKTEVHIPVVPPVEIKKISPSPLVRTVATSSSPWSFDLTLTNHLQSQFRGAVTISSDSFRIVGAAQTLLLSPGETRTITVQDRPTTKKSIARVAEGSVSFLVKTANPGETVAQRSVRALYSNARVSAGLKVGYIPSFDQTLRHSLKALGVEAKELTVSDIADGDLAKYNSIIIDNRGYEAHRDLIKANQRLLEFVKNGGTLIVFYHKADEWNPDEKKGRPQLAPYKIILGDRRVTEEDAPVSFLVPNHPLLRTPNVITGKDFKDWVQERGLYYPESWDERYQALLSTHDKDEPSLSGGLLVGSYGQGKYIYTSMVWYRQLQAGLPGAYRVFANMIDF